MDFYGLSLWIILDNNEIRYPNGLLIPAPQYETVPPNSKHLEEFFVVGVFNIRVRSFPLILNSKPYYLKKLTCSISKSLKLNSFCSSI